MTSNLNNKKYCGSHWEALFRSSGQCLDFGTAFGNYNDDVLMIAYLGYLICTRHCAKCTTLITSFKLKSTLWCGYYCRLHFVNKKTQAQKGWSHLFKVTYERCTRDGVQTQAVRLHTYTLNHWGLWAKLELNKIPRILKTWSVQHFPLQWTLAVWDHPSSHSLPSYFLLLVVLSIVQRTAPPCLDH